MVKSGCKGGVADFFGTLYGGDRCQNLVKSSRKGGGCYERLVKVAPEAAVSAKTVSSRYLGQSKASNNTATGDCGSGAASKLSSFHFQRIRAILQSWHSFQPNVVFQSTHL